MCQPASQPAVRVIFAAEMRLRQHDGDGDGLREVGPRPSPPRTLLTNLAVKTGGAEQLKQRQRQ